MNSVEFSAKRLRYFCPCNEIKFVLLAKFSITDATQNLKRAHTLDFSEKQVSKCLLFEHQLVRVLFQYNQMTVRGGAVKSR